jgi:hypothetical protein
MDEKYLETIKRMTNPSHSEIMRNVFKPTSEAELERIKEYNRTHPGVKIFISPKNPEWFTRKSPSYPVRENEPPVSSLEKEMANPFVQTPQSKMYKEALQKIDSLDEKRMYIDALEKAKYKDMPESYPSEYFTDPAYKELGKEKIKLYNKLNKAYSEDYPYLKQESKEKYYNKIDDLFNELVRLGKFQKA